MGTLGIVLALALSFCGWVYRANLNMKLLGAVRKGDAEAARLLLARGADPNIRDVPQQLSLWQQIRYAFHKDRLPSDDQHFTLLEMAMNMVMNPDIQDHATTGNVPLIKTLLEAGARPDDSSDDVTPLMVAVQGDYPQVVQLLLAHGANPLAKDNEGQLPINHLFVSNDDPRKLEIVELLVQGGSDVNVANNKGETALMDSCGWGDIRELRFLLAHGARVNVRDNNGNTPLMHYLKFSGSENKDVVKLLIAHGADVNQRNKAGETPLSLAKSREDKQSIRFLEAAGAKR